MAWDTIVVIATILTTTGVAFGVLRKEIRALREEIRGTQTEILAEIKAMQTEVLVEIKETHIELLTEIRDLRAEITGNRRAPARNSRESSEIRGYFTDITHKNRAKHDSRVEQVTKICEDLTRSAVFESMKQSAQRKRIRPHSSLARRLTRRASARIHAALLKWNF